MHLGILQCGHVPDAVAETSGAYGTLIAGLLDGHGITQTLWSVVDGVFPDGPDAADGWLVTGSKHGAYEDLPWIAPLEALICQIHAAQKPLVGICFGHQIIAQALGGRVEKWQGGWRVGAQSYQIAGQSLCLNAWHQDQVTALPPGAEVLGSGPDSAHAALAIGANVLTIQPHPEFPNAVVEALIETRGATVPPELLAEARAGLARNPDNARLGAWIADVLNGADARLGPPARAPMAEAAP